MIDAKQKLWFQLHKGKIAGIRFYRQYPIGAYTAEFYAPSIKLMIEIDGAQHQDHANRLNDLDRTRKLHVLGVRILRLNNLQILHETNVALEIIHQVATHMISSLPAENPT